MTYDGEHYTLPYPGGTGLGKAVKLDHAPAPRGPADLPRGRGPEERRAQPPRSPTAGWRSTSRPRSTASTATRSPRGSRRPGARRGFDDFDRRGDGPGDHPRRRRGGRGLPAPGARALHRRHGRTRGELPRQRVRRGWATRPRPARSRTSTSQGKKDEAAALVPQSLIEETALIGPKEKIRDDLEMWRESLRHRAAALRRRHTLRTHGRALPVAPAPLPRGRSTTSSASVSIQAGPSGSRKFCSSARITSRQSGSAAMPKKSRALRNHST